MKRYYQIIFISLFLLVIFSVPVIQTIYEYSTNENHRIQMFDIIEDTFIDPVRKADTDLKTIQALLNATEFLENRRVLSFTSQENQELQTGQDTVLSILDESVFKLTSLKQNVINYNRHINNENSRFLSNDTATEYFKLLNRLQDDFGSLASYFQNGEDASIAAVKNEEMDHLHNEIAELKENTERLKSIRSNGNGLRRNLNLILTAMKRNLVGADYLRPYEKEMEKSSVFANNIRPLLLSSYYALYGDLGDKGVKGRNGWIFYRPDIDYLVRPSIVDSRYRFYDPNDTPVRDSIIDTIAAFRDQLAVKGIDLLVVIMPGKPSIYPDLLNPSLADKSFEKSVPSQDILVELKKRNVAVVDLFSALANERKRDGVAGDSIYLRTDTHFKSRGVLAVASAVAQGVKQYPWFEYGDSEYIIDSVNVLRNGDIAEMTTPPATGFKCLGFSFEQEKTRCYQVYRISRDENGNELQRALYKDDYQKSKILVLGDSFSRIYQTDEPRSAGWIAHLAKELGQPVASIVNDGGASTLVRKTLERKSSVLRGKKLVIWEIVERDFRYGADGWKNVKL